jgi:methylmalonyl-CoA/ethylmalonyl-CoA epimerase
VGVTGLHHIGYVVPRMSVALSRFVADGAQVLVEPIDDPVQRVTVALVLADGVAPVELVAPMAGADSPISGRLRRGGGLDHLCYSVGDLAESLEAEESRGAMVVCQPVFAVAFRRNIAFVQRRSGMVVELITDREVTPA